MSAGMRAGQRAAERRLPAPGLVAGSDFAAAAAAASLGKTRQGVPEEEVGGVWRWRCCRAAVHRSLRAAFHPVALQELLLAAGPPGGMQRCQRAGGCQALRAAALLHQHGRHSVGCVFTGA